MRAPSPIPAIPSEPAVSDLLRGLWLPARALGLIVRTPRLRGLSLACAAVTAATLAGVGVGAWQLAHRFSAWLVDGATGWQHALAFGVTSLSFVVLFAAGALTLPNLVLAPLQDPLSEATEAACGDFTPAPFSLRGVLRGTLESLRHTLLRLTLMALGYLVLLPLNLIPAAGSVLYVVLSSAWVMFWLAVEHLSNPMARHLRPFGQVVRALRRRLPLALGVGAALWVLLWIPVLNCLLMPVAVVAGTLLYRSLQQAGDLPESQ